MMLCSRDRNTDDIHVWSYRCELDNFGSSSKSEGYTSASSESISVSEPETPGQQGQGSEEKESNADEIKNNTNTDVISSNTDVIDDDLAKQSNPTHSPQISTDVGAITDKTTTDVGPNSNTRNDAEITIIDNDEAKTMSPNGVKKKMDKAITDMSVTATNTDTTIIGPLEVIVNTPSPLPIKPSPMVMDLKTFDPFDTPISTPPNRTTTEIVHEKITSTVSKNDEKQEVVENNSDQSEKAVNSEHDVIDNEDQEYSSQSSTFGITTGAFHFVPVWTIRRYGIPLFVVFRYCQP